jgi:hypothetical protein
VDLRGESAAKDRSGDPGHSLSESLASSASAQDLPTDGPSIGEVEVLDRDRGDVVPIGVADEAGDGVSDLGVTAGAAPGEAELDPLGPADRVAVHVEPADGEVAVVKVHSHDRPDGVHFGT